jgi:hypothetical protein
MLSLVAYRGDTTPVNRQSRACDEKSGERRGDHLTIATMVSACFRKVFAAQVPELPQANRYKRRLQGN